MINQNPSEVFAELSFCGYTNGLSAASFDSTLVQHIWGTQLIRINDSGLLLGLRHTSATMLLLCITFVLIAHLNLGVICVRIRLESIHARSPYASWSSS